jgi:Putative outer membrane beta-barrel porin, MtrB/PioB
MPVPAPEGDSVKHPLRSCLSALLGLFSLHALAAPAQPEQGPSVVLGVGVEQTDNAFKSSSDERDETKEYLNLGLGYLRSGEALSAKFDYQSEFANYENNTTDDDIVVTGSTNLQWNALPGRIQLSVDHQRSEQLRDSRDPDIRNNRQLRDILSAGPAFTARMSPVDYLVLTGKLTQVSYDKSGADAVSGQRGGRDSDRVQGGLAWQHRLNKTDVLSANYQHSTTEFDGTDVEITFQQLFASYEVRLRMSGYNIALGVNRSERKGGASNDGFYGQIGGDLALGAHRFRLVAINQLTDSGVGLGNNSLLAGDTSPRDNNFDVADVVERSSLDLNYGYDGICSRCTLDLGVRYDEQDFDIEPRDQKNNGINASFSYRLTPTLKASLRGGYAEIEFPQDPAGGRTDKRKQYGASVDWSLSPQLALKFFLSQDSRDSSRGRDYDEVFGGISAAYTLR